MDQKILRLPEVVINQIAAGEVVEHAPSIVKELIENSLDAGASHIIVEILGGGQQLIRVEDDGSGMGPEDAVLCLERHATSKIRSVDDLQALGTMGFRGEALAAIGAVSQFELKTSDGRVGTRVLVEGGVIRTVEPCARNRGTTIEVRSLFYNVPARKKFQKSAATNASQVTRVLETIALAHPEITFSLNGKREFSAATRQERIEEILGPYEHEVCGEEVSGFVAAPSRAGATRAGQYLFINRRPIVSPLISKAVKVGFGTRIAEHTYPPFVLFLEIAPDRVDFNVHPQKKEVRFKDEGAIFRSVQRAVESAFSSPVVFTEPLILTPPSFREESSPPSFEWLIQEPAPELPLPFSDRPLAVFGPYLLLQKEHLLVVDLRGVYARILFESLQKTTPHTQALLWPLEIAIHPGEEGIVEEWNQIGIECRLLGRKSIAIDTLPSPLEAAHVPLFLESWREKKGIDQVIHSLCRRLYKQYSLAEGMALWNQLRQCRDQTYDPLGNPLWVELKEETFEKWFKHG